MNFVQLFIISHEFLQVEFRCLFAIRQKYFNAKPSFEHPK